MSVATGLHPIIPEADYHAGLTDVPSLSSSIANVLLTECPRAAWGRHPKLNPEWRATEASSDMDYGSAVHALVLEGTDKRITIVDEKDWRKDAAKVARDEARFLGKIPLLIHKYHSACHMASEVRAQLLNTELGNVLGEPGDAEITGVWTEPNGVVCRMRADWLTAPRDICLDLKTSGVSANPQTWWRQVLPMGYDVQAAFYIRGIKAITGIEPKFVFVVAEAEAPFLLSLTSLPPAWLDIARRKVEYAIKLFGECLKADKWPAYTGRICYPDMPEWAESAWIAREIAEEMPR